jgi:imidazolonepropionase-like amidohydrolase
MKDHVSILISVLLMATPLCSTVLGNDSANANQGTAVTSSAFSDSSQPIVLLCGNLWDGQADRSLGPMEILVRDGKIAEMGEKVSRPAGGKVVDLSDQTVVPGFIDCHVHMTFSPENMAVVLTDSQAMAFLHSFEHLNEVLMNGFTTVRDVGTMPNWEFVNIDLKNAINQGKIVGPRMIVAPHIISSTGGHGDYNGMMAFVLREALNSYTIADGPAEVQKVVREEIKSGADWVKCADTGGFDSPTSDPGKCTYTQEEMNALVKTSHDQGRPVCVHAYGDEGVKRAVIAGADSIEHGSMVSVDVLKMMETNGTYIVPTQYTFVEAFENINNTTYWSTRTPWEYQKTVKYMPVVLNCQKNLAKSNVKIAFGTDVGTFAYRDSWKEFPTMVKNGISPLRALKAATSVAAEMLGRPDLGTLAVGKTADIIAMPDDPFEEINATGNVSFVMKEGKIYKKA